MEARNAHGTENCSLVSRDFTDALSSQLFQPHQLPRFPLGERCCTQKQVSPGHEARGLGSFQDGMARQLAGVETGVTWPQGSAAP